MPAPRFVREQLAVQLDVMKHRTFVLALGLVACTTTAFEVEQPDPSRAAVRLNSATPDWDASLIFDNEETGIWTVGAYSVFPQHGSPEVVGLDDKGRCHVLVSYSGKWTPLTRCGDGKWLGGLCHADVDTRVAGAELYTGGMRGNIYQLVPYEHGALDCRLIAHLPGLEVHTLLAGDFDPRSAGPEILAFTRPGNLYRLTPDGPDGAFVSEHIEQLPGRVRDALVIPAHGASRPAIATVSRAGRLELLTFDENGTRWESVYAAPMGMGRLALKRPRAGEPTVLYATHDDGRILRFERQASDDWTSETIYNGPQGPRGVASGRFDPDPDVETVAVFGYSREVELLTRGAAGWSTETLFVDRDKGHWLDAAELDGRNATDELIGSGYAGRVFMLARPPAVGP
jgi:hypothetical protein